MFLDWFKYLLVIFGFERYTSVTQCVQNYCRLLSFFSASLSKSDVQGALNLFKFRIKTWVIFD